MRDEASREKVLSGRRGLRWELGLGSACVRAEPRKMQKRWSQGSAMCFTVREVFRREC